MAHSQLQVSDESLRRLIIATYQETIKRAEIPEDLKQALKAHERVPAFLRNLEVEFQKLPQKFQSIDQVTFCTRELTLQFIKNIKLKADQMMLSDAEKMRIETKHDKAKVLNQAATDGIITEEVLSVLEES